jgi:adenine-specific DNA-methyltransferase
MGHCLRVLDGFWRTSDRHDVAVPFFIAPLSEVAPNMNLTDRDKQIIKDCIDRGEPLPAKYKLMLFADSPEVELIWQGKSSEVTSVVLPFQSIEQIDEPRQEVGKQIGSLFAADVRGRQSSGWTNKLIWGDNKLVLSSLKNGPLRRQIEDQGGLKLIYIDPPFDVGADFSFDVDVGDDTLTKEPSMIEELAYRDTWGKSGERYIQYMYERLKIMHDLLAEDGSIFVHCDYRMNSYLRIILDEIFVSANFRNEIISRRAQTKSLQKQFQSVRTMNVFHDTILWYSKHPDSRYAGAQKEATEAQQQESWQSMWNNADRPTMRYQLLGVTITQGQWKWEKERALVAVKNYEEYDKNHSISKSLTQYWQETGCVKQFIRRKGSGRPEYWIPPRVKVLADTNWLDIPGYSYSTGYYTEKSEPLLERVITGHSCKGDLVADFFCGSGTTLAVAEKLERKWVGCDLGRFAIHTTRKRLIGVQRELKAKGEPYRSFEILNLGKYERQYFIGVDLNLPEEQRKAQTIQREEHYLTLILSAYKAERVFQMPPFHGKQGNTAVVVGPIDAPVTLSQVNDIIIECCKKKIGRVDVLGFEFEMSLTPVIQDEAKAKGVSLSLKYIPKDVFDRRAVERGQVQFYDVAYVEVLPKVQGQAVTVALKDFGVFYRQDNLNILGEKLKNGGIKVTVDRGQVVKITKDKNGKVSKEQLTKKWTDWIDYWSVDFDFENRKEIIRIVEDGKGKEVWTGNYIFENEWQSYRTRKNRTLELTSAKHEYDKKGRYKIAVKVIDIFGNDTTKVVEVKV